ncbi:MAG TPA: Uma2 family endonuclease [Candidatus Nanopelagicales bacterium]|nr:Uma2 family endonuclease [Candidatus Nanopelagicales bacterium]
MHAPSRDQHNRRAEPDEGRRWPRLDDHLVEPETRQEMIRGQVIYAAPAREPHAEAHSRVDGEAQFHVRPGYVAAADLLTRVSQDSEIAPDVSIRKEGIDPATGTRFLEEVAIEVVHTQGKVDVSQRATLLAARGVRRIFAMFVERRELSEWSAAEGRWRALPADGEIDDPCFVRPLPVRSLWDAKEGENAVVRALADKGNEVIATLLQAARGEAERKAAEAERKAGEAERKAGEAEQRADAERAAKDAALRELAELKARFGLNG